MGAGAGLTKPRKETLLTVQEIQLDSSVVKAHAPPPQMHPKETKVCRDTNLVEENFQKYTFSLRRVSKTF